MQDDRAHLALQKPRVPKFPGATSYVCSAFSVNEHLALQKPRVASLPGATSYVCSALGVDEQKTSMSVVVSGGVAWHPVGPILFWDQSNTPCTTHQNGTDARQSKPETSFRKASQNGANGLLSIHTNRDSRGLFFLLTFVFTKR